MDVIMQNQLTQARVGEPGCVGVEVDVFHNDGHVGAGPPRDADTHQRVLLLGHRHHLKHPQRVWQGEVKMLQSTKVHIKSPLEYLCVDFISHRAASKADCFVKGHLNLQSFSHSMVFN